MTRYRPRLLLAAIALGGALGWAYQDTFGWILTGWRENPYFSHGPLVPLLTAALLWRLRHALLSAAWRTDWRGLAVVALAGLMFIGGRVIDLNYAVGLSLVVLLHGVTWTVAGPEVARLAFFPLSFLAFGVPLSQLVIHAYSFPLQLASARLATGTMNLLTGAQAYADGTLMRMDGLDYLVAVECSGFKALLGLTMVGVLAAYLTDTSRSRRIGIALLAAPIAVASNVVRLFLILIVGRLWGHEFAVTTFHDMSGLVMLVV
ncbi:MAG: exosortase/archaeosortase family protein, partial [Armatimonadetes bacterium]|nr:exosortase/archaeosortase family protein [Armatimonadota bacterium]